MLITQAAVRLAWGWIIEVSTMKKSERLNRKINRLFRRAGHPRWAHHMGPKKFQTWILCLGLIVKQVYQLSYRRAMKFLDEFYGIKLHWTTLQKAAKRLPKSLWQSLLAATIECLHSAGVLTSGSYTSFIRQSRTTLAATGVTAMQATAL